MKIKISAILVMIIISFFAFTADALAYPLTPPCGDANGDGAIDISDIIYLVDYAFNDGPAMPYDLAIDFDYNGWIDISDLVMFVDYILHDYVLDGCSFIENKKSPCLSQLRENNLRDFAQSDCQTELVDSTEQMFAEWIGDNIKITHLKDYEQCCLEYKVVYDVVYDYEQHKIHMTAVESDTGYECDCLCYFDLESYSPFLMISGEMDCLITLIGIGGDTVGTDSLKVGTLGSLVCEVDGSDLTVTHKNAYFNCCPHFMTEIDFVGNNITLNWVDTLGECLCLCYYDLQTIFYDLNKGTYTVTLLGGGAGTTDTVGVETVYINDPLYGTSGPEVNIIKED